MNNNIKNKEKDLQYQLWELRNKNRIDKFFYLIFPDVVNSMLFSIVFTIALQNLLKLDSIQNWNNQEKWIIMLICTVLSFIFFYVIFLFIRNVFERAINNNIIASFKKKIFPIILLYILSIFLADIVMQNLLNEKIIEEMSLHKMNLLIDRIEISHSIMTKKIGYLFMFGGIALIYWGFTYNLISFQIAKNNELNEAERNLFEKEFEKSKKINLIDQVEIFSAIQHELANCIPTLINDFNDFIDYLNSNTGFESELGKPIFEGSNETVEVLINTIRKKASRAIVTTTDFSEIIKSNPKYFQPERIDLLPYLKQEFNKHADSSINIIYIGNESVFCEIDKLQFSYVIKNLITNASRHGFQNITNKIIEVEVLSINSFNFQKDSKEFRNYFIHSRNQGDEPNIIIRVKNNGSPVKEGFTIEDFKTLYKKTGEFGNTGIGGYNISIILINHGGEIKFNNEIINNSAYNVCFEITLPLKL